MRRRPDTRFVQIHWHLLWSGIAGLLSLNIFGNSAVAVLAGAAVYVVLSYKEPAVIRLTANAVVVRVGPLGRLRYEIPPAELRTEFESGFLTATVTIRAKDRRKLGILRQLSFWENPMVPSSGLQRSLSAVYGDRRERDLTDSSWKSTM